MLENGACFWRLPICAFFSKDMERKEVPDLSNDFLQLWNCFGYHHSVIHFSFLIGQRAKYIGKDKKFYHC